MIKEHSSFKEYSTGTLYLVPTPIGNLDDMSVRAVQTLKNVDLIAAEDTRNTQKLLNHFDVKTKQISFHEHNTQERIPELIEKLQNGISIAQVSDAGMPSISDPGKELVAACVKHDLTVVPISGPNAALLALIASGINPQPFYFYGFLPRKKSLLHQELGKLSQLTDTFILYESPYRIKKTVDHLITAFGENRQVVLARELTKIHEAFLRGSLSEIKQYYTEHDPRGEYVIIVSGKTDDPNKLAEELTDQDIKDLVQAQIKRGSKPNQAIKQITKQYNLNRKHVYNLVHDLGDNN